MVGAGVMREGLAQHTNGQCSRTDGKTLENIHRGAGHRCGIAHDDALRHARNGISFAQRPRIEQMVRRLFKRREHEHAILHLRDTEPRDAQDLALGSPVSRGTSAHTRTGNVPCKS